MGWAYARPETVCLDHGLEDGGGHVLGRAPSLSSGWTSDLAKRRSGWRWGWIAGALGPLVQAMASVLSRVAIWSMKAPVPPAQVPFMRCSMPLSK